MAKREREDEDEEVTMFDLDPNELDKAWLLQPKRMKRACRKLADADADHDAAKAELDLVRAELDLSIRSNPKRYKLPEKLSESMIGSCIITQEEYTTALMALHEAKHRVAILKTDVTALDHNRSALEGMVKLHGQSYFAACRATPEDEEAVAEYQHRKKRKSS